MSQQSKPIVHHLSAGVASCGLVKGIPSSWDEGQLWSNDLDDVTCEDCLFNLACEEDVNEEELENELIEIILKQRK